MMNIDNLSIVCWNVSCFGDPTKCDLVKDTLQVYKDCILCLQETKLNEILFSKLYSFLPNSYSNHTMVPIGSRRGTLTAWNSSLSLNYVYDLTFSNTVVLTNNLGFQFMLTNIYGPVDNNLITNIFLIEIRMVYCLHNLP
jgi:exonuclease III